MARFVYDISRTFSHRRLAELLDSLEKVAPAGRRYLEAIPANQWRNTAWLDDSTLPPRFGIVTTNMSESANSMLEDARNGSWLQTVDLILGKMVERICQIRDKHVGKTG